MTQPLPPERDSAFARYAGGVLVRFSGDVATCAKWVGYARVLLGQVRHRAALGGYEVASRHVVAPDGTRIGALWNGTMNIITVQAGGAVLPERVEAFGFPYLSGIHEITLWAAPQDLPVKWAGQFYPARATVAGVVREWYTYSNTADWTAWPVTDFASKLPRERFIAGEVYPTKPWKDATAFVKGRYYAGMYTGKMRRVIQKAYGAGLIAARPPSLDTACGIFIPEISNTLDIDKQRWVIQILRDGVYAFPIAFVDERQGLTSEELQGFSGWPQDRQDRYDYGLSQMPAIPGAVAETWATYDALPVAELGGHKVRLISTARLDEVYIDGFGAARTPASDWYPVWAFDPTGHKAVAVLIGVEAYNGTQKLYKAYRFELRIGQDDEGRPDSAQIVEVESDYLLTWALTSAPGPLSVHPLSMPHPITGDKAVFTFWDRPENDRSAPQPAYRDAPVYAFYNRSGACIVLRHRYEAYTARPDEIVDGIIPSTWTAVKPAGETYPALYNWASPNLLTAYFEVRDNIQRGYNCYYVDGIVAAQPTEHSRLQTVQSSTEFDDPAYWLFGGFSAYGDGTTDTEATRLYLRHCLQLHDPYHWQDTTNLHHVGVPSYEREGLFVYQDVQRVTDSRTINTYAGTTLIYPGLNGRAVWDLGGSANWTVVSTHATAAFSGAVVDWQGYAGFLPLMGWPSVLAYTNPGETLHDERYFYIGGIAATTQVGGTATEGVLELIPPADAADWFDDLEQFYVAANGAFSGRCLAAPWPGPLYWEYDADYPLDTSYRWPQYPIQFPDVMFVGDETTDAKSDLGNIDIEAIPYG